MNPNGPFERELERWLLAEAPASAPVGLHAAVIGRARTMRQRPGWATSVPAPWFGRDRGRGITLLAAAALVLVGGAVAATGSGLVRLPSPVPPAPSLAAIVAPSQAPESSVPTGVATAWTEEEVAQRALADIALTERQLGRVLAPARIIRVVLLPPRAEYHLRQLDGIRYLGTGWYDDASSWVVEAVGTFASFGMPGEDGPVTSAGTHGYFTYVEAGSSVGDAGGSRGFFPCWFRYPQPADTTMEGTCSPTSGEPGQTVTPTQH